MTLAAFSFNVTKAGRTTLPAGVRKEAGIQGEVEMVARADGRGRIILETREAVLESLWSKAPQNAGLDLGADVRALRNEDRATSDAHFVARDDSAVDTDGLSVVIGELGL